MPDVAPKQAEKKPEFFLVKMTHPQNHGRVVFRSVSEKRAKTWVENHYPRGSEAYLETPAGKTFHYEAERAGEQGADVDSWSAFDPESWVSPAQSAPPGQDEWADKEG